MACLNCQSEKIYAKGLCSRCYRKQWHEQHRESELLKSHQYHEKHKLEENAKSRQWYSEHKNYHKRYYAQKQGKERARKFYNTNLNWRLSVCLRNRIRAALKEQLVGKIHPRSKLEELIGCSMAELQQYLESKFQPGMTWSLS